MDSPIYNLTATKQLLEFELNHLTTFVNLLHSFHKEKSKDLKESLNDIISSSSNSSKISAAYLNSLENSKSDKLYHDNFNKELKFYINRLNDLKERIKNIDNEINEKRVSKEKLTKLFDSLEILNEKEKEQQQQQQNNELNDSLDSEFPVMEIREELDDDDNILSSSVSPYGSNPISKITKNNKEIDIPKETKEEKEEKKPTQQLETAKKNVEPESKPIKQNTYVKEELESDLPSDFVPMMIREDLEDDDEDDYKIKSSTISQLPVGSKGKISETKIKNPKIEEIVDKNDKIETSAEIEHQSEGEEEDENIDADEIRQLLEDMGISEPKIKEMADDVTMVPQPEMKDAKKEPVKQQEGAQEEQVDIVSQLEDLQKYNNTPAIDPEDLLTLEFIADELNDENDLEEGEDPNFEDYNQWELQEGDEEEDGYEFEEGEEEEEEDEDEDEEEEEEEEDNDEDDEDKNQFKKFSMMVPQKAQNNFWKQIQELRKAKSQESGITNGSQTNEDIKETITESTQEIKQNSKKDSKRTKKKSVKFSEKVEVKEVENIWNEMNFNLNADTKISAFRRRIMGMSNNSINGPLPLPKSSIETTPKDRLSPRFESALKEILEDSNTTTTTKSSITTSSLSDTSKSISVTEDEDAVSQLVFERPFISKKTEEPISIKESVQEAQQQIITPINDQTLLNPPQKPELPKLNTAKEKDTSEAEEELAAEKPQKISKFKQNLLNRNKNETPKPPASFQSSVISEAIVKETNVDNSTPNTTTEEKTLRSASKIVENRSMNPDLLFKPFNKKLNSLKPPSSNKKSKKSTGIPIFHPKDPNPDVPYSEDIDYDAIRVDNYDIDEVDETNLDNNLIGEDTSENAVDEKYQSTNSQIVDDEKIEEATKEKKVKEFPTLYIKETGDDNKPVSKEKDDLEIVDTTLDYKTLQDDMDTMAKAYVLGLYDDDIATDGEIVEKLADFEKINKIVEEKEKNSLNIPSNDDLEEDKEKDDKSVMTDEIVEKFISNSTNTEITENDIEQEEDVDFPIVEIDNDQLDYEINPDLLEQNVALDYHRLRRKMIHKFNGSYKQGAKEKEFEPIDEEGNTIKVSRFKAARLDINQ
ncbi:hypothetical protein B5S28_g374 [[Candida] boidinii]|nr:hypothetical protein B5S28_g374 [[Candida] boidinii]OWB62915.1 hypothetical protein B5S29_g3864 [[Candida] boidinii]